MANGIDRRYTGIPMIPQVVEEKTSMWDAIVPLAQMAKEEKARQDALKLKWEGIRQIDEEAADLKQYRSDDLAQKKVYQKGQIDAADERNSIARMEFEKKQSDEREAEAFTVAGSAKDYKDQVRLLRELANSTGKTSYNARADLIETDGIAKESMSEFKNNLSQEDNPYKIQEYLRREGDNLIKHYGEPAFNILQKRSDYLMSTYDTTEANVRNSDIYKGLRDQIHIEMGQPGMFNKHPKTGDKYTIDDYKEAISGAALETEQIMQEGLTQKGIMPTDDDAMDKIWDNEEAREAYFANPLDDVNKIMEKYELVEKEEVDEDDEEDADAITTVGKEVSVLEEKLETLKTSGFTTLPEYKSIQDELTQKRQELLKIQEEEELLKTATSTGIPIEDLRRERQRQRTPGAPRLVRTPGTFAPPTK